MILKLKYVDFSYFKNWMIYLNESHTARLRFASFRWCGIRPEWFFIAVPSSITLRSISLMRHSPHKIKRKELVMKASFLPNSFLSICTAHCLRTKKSTTPGNLMSETVPASAPPGARTLHTLKALVHFISVY